MELNDILSTMTPEIRDNLATAIEIGRWPDGSKLTQQQLESAMKAVIAWDANFGEKTDEPFKVQKGGDINRTVKKTASKDSNSQDTSSQDREVIKTISLDID